MTLLAVLSAVLWVPSVTSQLLRQQGNDDFPKGFGSSFSLPPARPAFDLPSAFLSGQPLPLSRVDTQRPFQPPQQPQPAFTPTTTNNNNNRASGGQKNPTRQSQGQGGLQGSQQGSNTFQSTPLPNKPSSKETHTYADGTTGGNYPAHMKALQKQQRQQQQLAVPGQPQVVQKNPDQEMHTYADGTTGGNYPDHMKALQKQQQQQQQQQRQQQRLAVPFGNAVQGQPQVIQQNPGQEMHTYADGTTGGNYPDHMKALQKQQQQQQQQRQQQQLAGPFGNAVQGQPQVIQQNPGQETHTYADGTTGGNYPDHMKALQKQQQQRQQRRQQQQRLAVPFGNAVQGQPQVIQQNPGQETHTYADGTTGGNYPDHMKALQKQQQQQQRQQQLAVPFGNAVQGQPQVVQQNPGQETHTYADGTTGGNYPDRMKALQKQQQQQQQQRQQQQRLAVPFGNAVQGQPQVIQQNPGQETHTYADGTTGGNYPDHKKALQKQQLQQQQQQQQQSNPAVIVGAVPQQFRAPVTPNKASLPTQQFLPPQTFASNFRGQQQRQTFPLVNNNPQQPQSFLPPSRSPSPAPRQVNGPVAFYPGGSPSSLASAVQGPTSSQFPQVQQSGNTPGQHTYADGTTGGNYPDHKAKQEAAAKSAGLSPSQTLPAGSFPATGNSFQPPSQRAPFGAQCFQRQNLAASYKLSDSAAGYPEKDILSELRSNQHLMPMVGLDSLPASKDNSPFLSFDGAFSSFSSLGFSDNTKTNTASNTKLFPANFDSNTLGSAMQPLDSACPAQFSPLKTLTIDSKRCFVVNSQFQDISFAKCSRQDCRQCGGGSGGVSVCVERYGWVTVMVYCSHWQRGQRVNAVRVYLPQGCSCNRYTC